MSGDPNDFDDELPEQLYHYTSAAGLHGILESNSLYGTHAAYLNDSQELLYGMQMALDELQAWLRSSPDDAKASLDSSKQLPSWLTSGAVKLVALLLSKEVQQRTQSLRQTFGPYVTCLSESRDQLSQWRGYGKGGGYAIRFDPLSLYASITRERMPYVLGLTAQSAEHNLPLGGARFLKMDYAPETQASVVRGHLITFVNEMAQIITAEKKPPEVIAQQRSELLEPLIRSLVSIAMRMKNPGFAEEKEYRIASFFAASLFSPSDRGLIPRIQFTFDPACVKEILIGPGLHMETRESSVRYYLDSRSQYPGVDVTRSKTPFRGD